MFKDVRAGIMHAGIFWGFVLLTIGTANIVTGGLIQSILSTPFDGVLWTAVSAKSGELLDCPFVMLLAPIQVSHQRSGIEQHRLAHCPYPRRCSWLEARSVTPESTIPHPSFIRSCMLRFDESSPEDNVAAMCCKSLRCSIGPFC